MSDVTSNMTVRYELVSLNKEQQLIWLSSRRYTSGVSRIILKDLKEIADVLALIQEYNFVAFHIHRIEVKAPI